MHQICIQSLGAGWLGRMERWWGEGDGVADTFVRNKFKTQAHSKLCPLAIKTVSVCILVCFQLYVITNSKSESMIFKCQKEFIFSFK